MERKEALATIRLMKPDLNSTELEALQTLIPELAESEEQMEESVGVAESPLKTFPRVNDFECGSSYRH